METSANEQKQRPLPPAGQHLALLYLIVDCGTQDGTFNGQPTAPARKVYMGWEFPNLPKVVFSQEKGEQPMAIFNEYTFSLSEKANFRKMIDSWIGQPVLKLNSETFAKLLGKPCLINIEHYQDKKNPAITKARISFKGIAIFKRPAEMSFPKTTINEKLYFDLDNFSWESFNKVEMKFLQEKIRKSHQWPSIISKHPETKGSSAVIADEQDVTMGVNDEEDPF